jgi:glycogen operon protein
MRAEAGEGQPEPLGATLTDGAARFAYPAPGADAVLICVFDARDREIARIRLPGRTGDVHHGEIAGLGEGTRYGLRVEGPWAPDRGHRFNPRKLLVDPWARALDRPFALHPSLFDTGETADDADSAPHLPKAVVAPSLPPLTPRARPRGPQVIYELHVKGFTARHPDIPPAIRGTFAALAHSAAVAHLASLGVTTVELMPAAAWIDERHLPPLGLRNYWGYNPMAPLAPDPRLAPGGMAEVREAVRALQRAGIAVIQDVVLNHTGEGDAFGPTLSLRGLGNAHYYRLRADARRYVDDAGCGNVLALDRPWALRLAMDALRHWAQAAGLDGFRLDLATTLARRDDGFDPDAPLIQAMRQDPVLRELLIVAEPWDIGAGGYRLGAFPAGWAEWNDRFRDDVRRFWRGDAGMAGALATRLAGSTDAFRARPLTDSINFVAAHDGFTLADLVSFSAKRNAANGERNRDGTNADHSWNNGAEGLSDDPGVRAARHADIRALLATLFCARGTPMLGMGDEAGRTQGGNNNAYAQDNATSWLDWEGMDDRLVAFTRRLVSARLAHPALHDGVALTGNGDVAWLKPDGTPMDEAAWRDSERRALLVLLAKGDDRCAVALNAGTAALPLALPALATARRQQRAGTRHAARGASGARGDSARRGAHGAGARRSRPVAAPGRSGGRRHPMARDFRPPPRTVR